MRSIVILGMLFCALNAEAQFFGVYKPVTGRGNWELKNLQDGYQFSAGNRLVMWDRGEYQDFWCSSFLPAEGSAPDKPEGPFETPEDEASALKPYLDWSEMYTPLKLLDGDLSTPWVEGAAWHGEGEVVMIPFKGTVARIYNGFQETPDLFQKNSRVKDLRVWILQADAQPGQFDMSYNNFLVLGHLDQTLRDTVEPQNLKIPSYTIKEDVYGHQRQGFLALEILSVYPGSRYQDTCISEVEIR